MHSTCTCTGTRRLDTDSWITGTVLVLVLILGPLVLVHVLILGPLILVLVLVLVHMYWYLDLWYCTGTDT